MGTPSGLSGRVDEFVTTVLSEGRARYRDFPWRDSRDPYAVLVSEVMLQQTQTARVVAYYVTWMEQFPTLEALEAAPMEAVLRVWQGLGYNRRAVSLKRLAGELVSRSDGGEASLPREWDALCALPGIGPATAAGVRAFAFNEHGTYLETNVRSVLLHELFPQSDRVSDRELIPVLESAAEVARQRGVSAIEWNQALLDYGAYLKSVVPNPSRRSATHTRQSRFEGSRRQARARLLRLVLDDPDLTAAEYADVLAARELRDHDAEELLGELVDEGFLVESQGRYRVG